MKKIVCVGLSMASSLIVVAGSMSFISFNSKNNSPALMTEPEREVSTLDITTPFISDSSNQIAINYNIAVNTLVSNLGANDAVALGPDGNVYVSNFGTYTNTGGTGTQVVKISPDGTSSIFVDGLAGPLGNAFDSKGNFYVVNGNNGEKGEVLKITASGTKSTIAEITGWPAGIVIDADDNLYISNYASPKVHKISAAGELTEYANEASLAGCVGIVLDANNNVVLGNYNNGKILSIDKSGVVSEITQIPGLPAGFAIGYITILDETIYATGIGNNKLYKVTLDGEYTIFAGTGKGSIEDGPILEASFHNPNGISADIINKKLYIVDFGTPTLREISLKE